MPGAVAPLGSTVTRVHRALATLRPGGADVWVLAVSGGIDSMVLLDAAAAVLPSARLLVATFDHGTGRWAAAAARLVARRAAALGVPCVCGRARGEDAGSPTEAAWRAARWAFLREVAARTGGTVVTAHTADDQLETVVMRVLRGAGARGLAALHAAGPVRRPLVQTPRAVVGAYAAARGVAYVDDPANTDRRHLRARVRHDLLPAIAAVRPAFAGEMEVLSRKAAALRGQIERAALKFPLMIQPSGAATFARAPFRDLSGPALRTLWPALAARAGVVLDRRGTERLAAFTIEGETGQSIQLAGGVAVAMERTALVFRGAAPPADRRAVRRPPIGAAATRRRPRG